jgi:hypothetical protein
VDLHRSFPAVVDQLSAAGRLTSGNVDDFADFPEPVAGVEPLDVTMDAVRGDR